MMIIINGSKWAQNDKEMIDSLFDAGGTAKGFYKVTKGGIKLFNLQHELFAFIVNNKNNEQFFVSAFMHDGRARYSYGLSSIDYKYIFPEPVSYSQAHDIAKAVFMQLN